MKRRPSQKLQKFQRGHATSSGRHHSISFLLFVHFSPGLISLDGQHNCGPTSRLSRRPRHLFAAEYDARERGKGGSSRPIITSTRGWKRGGRRGRELRHQQQARRSATAATTPHDAFHGVLFGGLDDGQHMIRRSGHAGQAVLT